MTTINGNYDTVLWDLDGTLINVKVRLYSLFCELTGERLSFEKYWDLKEQGYNQQQMLKIVDYQGDYREFHNRWLSNVERIDLLAKDVLVDGAEKILSDLRKSNIKMYIVTNRQIYNNLNLQLTFFNIRGYFEEVWSTFQKCSKAEVVLSKQINIGKAVFIGDSVEDMREAKEMNVFSIMITSGNAKCSCSSVQADLYVKKMNDIGDILL